MKAALALTLVTICAAGLAACGGDETSANPPPPPPATTARRLLPATSSAATASASARPRDETVRVVVRGGKVRGGIQRATVEQGKKVAIVVGSDVADHVHLHGYDKFADVAPGKPARLVFVASIPGRFEVELEDRGLQIADIEVRP